MDGGQMGLDLMHSLGPGFHGLQHVLLLDLALQPIMFAVCLSAYVPSHKQHAICHLLKRFAPVVKVFRRCWAY